MFRELKFTRVTEEQNEALTAVITDEDINKAILNLKTNESPGAAEWSLKVTFIPLLVKEGEIPHSLVLSGNAPVIDLLLPFI